jgi:transcriptional regulator with XRE-family HTH domain
MTKDQFKAGRLKVGLTQNQAAATLGVSQPYLSQMEMGQRPITPELARSATSLYRLPATALPMPEPPSQAKPTDAGHLARQLAGLGYPGFAHLRARKTNPAAVVLEAVLQRDLETRLAEALPWVLLNYPDLDWPWLVRHIKLEDAQNRLGFLVSVARNLAEKRADLQTAFTRLSEVERQLERARLAREDTLCRESMPTAERRWLKENRSALALHWNLLTGLTAEQLPYAA